MQLENGTDTIIPLLLYYEVLRMTLVFIEL